MSEICWAWDWNISSENTMQIDSSESQIPDMQIDKEVFKKDNKLTAKLQTEEDQILQKKREIIINNKADKSLINYQAIQTILKTEIESEKNKNVQQAILKQLELLQAILEFKSSDKIENLNAKLQKQSQKQTQKIIPAQIQAQNQTQE